MEDAFTILSLVIYVAQEFHSLKLSWK